MEMTDGELRRTLKRIENLLWLVLKREGKLMDEITDVQSAVTEQVTVEQGVVVLMAHMADLIEANKQDPVALAALAVSIRANTKSLSDAVAAVPPDITGASGPGASGAA